MLEPVALRGHTSFEGQVNEMKDENEGREGRRSDFSYIALLHHPMNR
jgi:hypothetical protein